MDSQPVSFLMLCGAEMNIILKFEIHHQFGILSQSWQGIFQNAKRQM